MAIPLTTKLRLWSEEQSTPPELRSLCVEAARIKDLDDKRIEELSKDLELIRDKDGVVKAARHYKALADERGEFLRKLHPLVRLPHAVRGDLIFAGTVAPPGIYVAELNPNGAASVKATNGKMLGIKPAEFEWLTEEELNKLLGAKA